MTRPDNRILLLIAAVSLLATVGTMVSCWPKEEKRVAVPYVEPKQDEEAEEEPADRQVNRDTPAQPDRRRPDAPTTTDDPANPKKPVKPPKAGIG